ncbi:asparagine synthase (glutamine-hydrolysing) [Halobacillus dabanensis]|uniref:asparagine synthase (glutamine-hydrolyzing) n=1 Tax=Halobacillus dabanensis TaxID=240302 RepID=A0A1I4AVZ4_HALDA|nr:asparagine synthase (glutamine-hydrolyzing) [Halobacillus dabanensis]SFK59806.1 asparagine synthase (glutamine-hydrolysing) [Halobacillus dabanensis]
MCGIVGYVNTGRDHNPEIIKTMMEKIHHRGPDQGGSYSDKVVSMGFRRLSIIDRSTYGNQPMFCEYDRFVMIFNGEIYNFQELKKDLIDKGHTFQSSADSEVVLHGYEQYGTEILQHLRGMFAFAIWDKVEEELFLARDPFGIKPLYYSEETSDGSFLFGSEIKSFLPYPKFTKAFNHDALQPFLTFQYSALKETFFKGVYKLLPGHYMLRKEGRTQTYRYWDIAYGETTGDLNTAIKEIKDAMSDSVRHHKISDVKVGSFLSGGIDSSYVTTLLKPEKTFSVGFGDYEGIFNETNIARDLSEKLNVENHRKLISADEFFAKVPTIQYHMDEPHANLSSVPLYFLSELASEHVTVVLSGEGADELFGGYDWYKISPEQKLYEKLPYTVRRAISRLSGKLPINRLTQFLTTGGQKVEKKFIGQAKVFSTKDALKVLKAPYQTERTPASILFSTYSKVSKANDSTKMQYTDIHHWLPGDILQKADKMSSAHSLELRVPFLDKKVMEVAQTLAPSLRTNGKDTKYALRQAAKSVMPDEWANRPKVGSPVPIRHWLRQKQYYDLVKRTLTSDMASEFFHTDELVRYLNEHYENKANHHRYIWTVYVFLQWYKVYFVQEHASSETVNNLSYA